MLKADDVRGVFETTLPETLLRPLVAPHIYLTNATTILTQGVPAYMTRRVPKRWPCFPLL